jgi:glycosyltransferase involved in cell wall biosynthesis
MLDRKHQQDGESHETGRRGQRDHRVPQQYGALGKEVAVDGVDVGGAPGAGSSIQSPCIQIGTRRLDCMDDLAAQAPTPRHAERWLDRALATADRVWTGTPSLADRLAGRHAHLRFVAGGVEGARFAAPDPAEVEAVRQDLPPGEGPVAGYFGVLNERVDMRCIEALLDSGPWRVLLIGPATSRAPRLPDHPRLRWIGPRPYRTLPAYLALFDLALIPYDTQGPHRYLYPVKALEYLAGGKPVLATPLEDLKRMLGAYVELADGPEAWREAGRRLLADRSAAQAKARNGQAEACRRTWDAMVDEMLEDLLDKSDGSDRSDKSDGSKKRFQSE